MSKRIKPNAEHRIVDGDIVSSDIDDKIERGRAFSAKREEDHKRNQDDFVTDDQPEKDPDSLLNDFDPKDNMSNLLKNKSFFTQHASKLFWVLLVIVVVATLYLTRPDTDWQVQKINDLQSEISLLKEQNQSVHEQLQEHIANHRELINSQVEDALAAPENKPAISKQDIEQVEAELAEKMTLLQQQLDTTRGQVEQQVRQAIEGLNNGVDALQPKAKQQLDQVEKDIQSKLSEMTAKLGELFVFKEEQNILNRQPSKLELDVPLNSLQIQQWIVEINTQWILNGRIDETKQQLFALEQAASLSDFTYTTQLARLIGQDLGYLRQLKQQEQARSKPDSMALKKAIAALTYSLPETSPGVEDTTKEKEGLDSLIDRFSQLITVKKRDSDTEITEVNSVLVNDVMKQRLALLVDRLEWGLTTQSKEVIKRTADDIKGFIKLNYPNSFAEFNGLLEPFVNYEFINKKPLSITRLDEALES